MSAVFDLSAAEFWNGLGWPMLRITCSLSVALIVANLIESLNWTRAMARVAAPIVRFARLKDVTGASFSMAFFSGLASNTMLAEAFEKGEISERELMLANLFNSLPTYFLHLPSLFLTTVPFLGHSAVIYVGMTLAAAFARTAAIILLARSVMPPLPEGCVVCRLDDHSEARSWRAALDKTLKRFKRRIGKVLTFTLPIYIAIYFTNRAGGFEVLERYLAEHVGFLSWLPTEALSIVVFHVASEFTSGLAAAGAILNAGTLPVKTVVMALLVGNVLSSPMRAFRHQFPYYAGIFKPRTAFHLILANQAMRAASVAVAAAAYWMLA